MLPNCFVYAMIVVINFGTLILANLKLRPCHMKTLNLQNSTLYISQSKDNPVSNVVDNNYDTHFHSDYQGGGLDHGLEWLIVHFDVQKVQLVHTVSLVSRSGLAYRNTKIDILTANTISKKLTQAEGERDIPWNEFILCGKTFSAQENPMIAEVKCATLHNARYVGLKRMFDHHAYCCLNFAELLVTVLDVYDEIPIVHQSDLSEGSNNYIRTDCSLPESAGIKTVWNEYFIQDGTSRSLGEEGDQIHFNNIVRQPPVKYNYNYVDKRTLAPLFTSMYSETLHVRYAATNLKIHSEEIVTVEEDAIIDINCTSDAGYPHPHLVLELDGTIGNVILGEEDKNGGRSGHSHLHVHAQLRWTEKFVTCTLIQTGFPNVTKHVVLHVKDKRENVNFPRSFPTFLKATMSSEDGFVLQLSPKYIASAFPNQFNISCAKKDTVYFSIVNHPVSNLHIHLPLAGEYVCTVDHKTCKKVLKFILSKGATVQNCNHNGTSV